MAAKPIPSEKIRNVAVVGHSSTGKTTLISAILFDAKEVNRLGKVDKGTAVTDFDDEAVERKITIATARRVRSPPRLQAQPDRHARILRSSRPRPSRASRSRRLR